MAKMPILATEALLCENRLYMFNGVLPKCFIEFDEFSDKKICHYGERTADLLPGHLLCKRPDAATAPARHM